MSVAHILSQDNLELDQSKLKDWIGTKTDFICTYRRSSESARSLPEIPTRPREPKEIVHAYDRILVRKLIGEF